MATQDFKIRFDMDDPEQAAVLDALQTMKKGSKGKVVSNVVVKLLSMYNLGGMLYSPEVCGRFLEIVSEMSLPVAEKKGEKKRDKQDKPKAKAKPKKQIPAPAEEKAPASAPAPEGNEAEAPVIETGHSTVEYSEPDGQYPWRLPDGRMRALTDAEAEAIQDNEELVELYAKEIMEYAAEHPEDAPKL